MTINPKKGIVKFNIKLLPVIITVIVNFRLRLFDLIVGYVGKDGVERGWNITLNGITRYVKGCSYPDKWLTSYKAYKIGWWLGGTFMTILFVETVIIISVFRHNLTVCITEGVIYFLWSLLVLRITR